jgi:hypothetical protein
VQLRALAQGALGCVGQREIAFAATGAALAVGGPHRARFLMLRARCLLRHDSRRQECLEVAAELARRQRDTGLLAEVMDEIGAWFAYDRAGNITVADEVVERVLSREAQAAMCAEAMPSGNGPSSGPTRRKRSVAKSRQPALFEDLFDQSEDDDDLPGYHGEGFFEEDLLDEDDDDWDNEENLEDAHVYAPLPQSSMPREVMDVVVAILIKGGGIMPSPKKLQAILAADPKLAKRLMDVFMKYGSAAGFGKVVDAFAGGFGFPAPLPPWAGNESRSERTKPRRQRGR